MNNYQLLPSILFIIFLINCDFKGSAQDTVKESTDIPFIMGEYYLGKTFSANKNFPELGIQQGILLGIGKKHMGLGAEWTRQLNKPLTGLVFAYTDFGNSENVGQALSVLSFLELRLFPGHTNRWNFHAGLGGSYMNKQYDPQINPNNKAISTKINWSLRSFLFYRLLTENNFNLRLGLGYIHHSNGHTKLPNQGLNSVVGSIAVQVDKQVKTSIEEQIVAPLEKARTSQLFWAARFGIGQNVLSTVFNEKKEVWTISIGAGKIINKTFKYGIGVYYRVYEHYYDYIIDNEQLVRDLYPYFREHPVLYASNFGISGSAELLLGHIGADIHIGVNFYKPFYKVDWQLNDGYTIEREDGDDIIVLGELGSYYRLKRAISTRLGLKWYFINTIKNPENNFYIGIHLNANLGQADFTELSLGFVHRFKEIKRKKHSN